MAGFSEIIWIYIKIHVTFGVIPVVYHSAEAGVRSPNLPPPAPRKESKATSGRESFLSLRN